MLGSFFAVAYHRVSLQVLYLLVLHLWTFALLAFHAHGFDTVHGAPLPYGPGALLQPSILPPAGGT